MLSIPGGDHYHFITYLNSSHFNTLMAKIENLRKNFFILSQNQKYIVLEVTVERGFFFFNNSN